MLRADGVMTLREWLTDFDLALSALLPSHAVLSGFLWLRF
jgi:hypothetical protein